MFLELGSFTLGLGFFLSLVNCLNSGLNTTLLLVKMHHRKLT